MIGSNQSKHYRYFTQDYGEKKENNVRIYQH